MVKDADALQCQSRDEQVGCQLPHIGDGDNGLVCIDRLQAMARRSNLPRGGSCLRACSWLWVDRRPCLVRSWCCSVLVIGRDCSRRCRRGLAVVNVSGSISDSTPACHAGERGSTPRQRDSFSFLHHRLSSFKFRVA